MSGAAAAALPAPSLDEDAGTARTFLERWGAVLLLAIALSFPFLDQALELGMMNPMLRILTSVMLALGLNIVVGMAGLLDLGYVAFWAIGAYVVGWFASGHFHEISFHLGSGLDAALPGIHVSFWLLIPVGVLFAAILGVIIGAPTLRLRGDYLAIVTLGFGEIIPRIFQNGDDIAGHNLTNGTAGISGLDAPSLGGPAVDQAMGVGWGTWGPLNLWPWYFLAVALVVLCWYVSVTLQWSKFGRAWMAIREDETAASAMGINLVATKLWAYGVGASLGGIAGVFHGARIGSIFPTSFQFYVSIAVLCMVIIGGMGNVYGAMLGAFIIEGLNFWLLPSLGDWSSAIGLDIDFASWNLFIFGGLLVVMMLFRPQGFLPQRARSITFDEHPEMPGHQHFPGGLHGPEGDERHAGHAVLEVGHEAHPPHGAPAPPAHEPETFDPAAPGEQPAAGAGAPPPRVAPEPPLAAPRRFARFDAGSNPFARRRAERVDDALAAPDADAGEDSA